MVAFWAAAIRYFFSEIPFVAKLIRQLFGSESSIAGFLVGPPPVAATARSNQTIRTAVLIRRPRAAAAE
jgi:hypothetical protein